MSERKQEATMMKTQPRGMLLRACGVAVRKAAPLLLLVLFAAAASQPHAGVCVCACVCVCARACVRVCVRVCVRACVRVSIVAARPTA